MLISLTIQDFVIVERLELQFQAGMSVLSGETGAGKSILIDALGLALGARADAAQVREGCDRANIAAVFKANPAARNFLNAQAIDCEEDDIILRRAIDSTGRSKAFINGTPVPLGTLRELADHLIDIHGQHAFQSLGKPAEQLRLLDEFGQHAPSLRAVGQAYSHLRDRQRLLEQARSNQADQKQRIETLEWKLTSLDQLQPKADEWLALSQDHDRLSHAAELIETSQWASGLLNQSDNALLDQLAQVIDRLAQWSDKDQRLLPIVQTLRDGEIQIREAAYDLQHYVSHSELDPDALARVEARLAQWHDTARKLRLPPDELHTHWEAMQQEMAQLTESQDIEALEKAYQAALLAYQTQADKLTTLRRQTAKMLAARVTESMQNLSMQGGVFEVAIEIDQASAKGSDSVEFRVAGHPGVTPQALGKVASGGELARISLAITVNTVAGTQVPTLIFDEVDSGIGGAVAQTVGTYLRTLAQAKQVLCVTHLPQVAAQGHHHFKVAKEISAGTTKSKIELLGQTARVQEVARMLGGQTITDAVITSAQELIDSALG